MSFWNRLGDFAKDVGGAMVATPKFVWDVATAPWNDNEDFNGFKNTMATAGGKFAASIVKPVTDIAEAPVIAPVLKKIDDINREVVREPLTNLMLMNKAEGDTLGERWANADKMGETTSLGQAAVGAIGSLLPGEQAVDKIDYTDQTAVDDFFSQGAAKFWSGAMDFSAQVFGDVTIIGGKAAKAARGAELVTNKIGQGAAGAKKAAKAINDIVDTTQNGITNKYTPWIEKFVENDSMYAYNHPAIRNSPVRDTVSYALGRAQTPEEVGLYLRAALNDPRALAKLKAERVDIGNAIEKQMGILDPYQEYLLKKIDDPEGITSLPHDELTVVLDTKKELDHLRAKDLEFAAWEKIAETPGGVLDRTTGASGVQKFEEFIAKGRSAKFQTATWQPTPFHKMYQKVTWLGAERPEGIINLNDSNSSAEVLAAVNRGMKLAGDEFYQFTSPATGEEKLFAGVSSAEGAQLMDGYMRAVTPEDRARSISVIENAIFSAICGKHGIDRATAEKAYQGYYKARHGAQESLRKNGFMIDENGTVLSVPQFESQTANYLPMMDFDMLNRILHRNAIARNNKPLSVAYGLGNEVVTLLDTIQSMFKAGVLMRLGYTVRNGTEAQLRIAASVGSMASLRHLGPGMKNFVFNTGDNVASRAVDRFSMNRGALQYEDVKSQLDKVDSSLTELGTNRKALQDRYDASVEANAAPAPEVEPFKPSFANEEEWRLIDEEGILPDRFWNDKETIAARKANEKYYLESYKNDILGDPFHQERVQSTASAFDLSPADAKILEAEGLIPLSKVEEAYASGKADELSAYISTGNVESASYEGHMAGEYAYRPIEDLRSGAFKRGKSNRKFIQVDWTPISREDYVRQGTEAFDADFYETKLDELTQRYLDENMKWIEDNNIGVEYIPPAVDVQAQADIITLNARIAEQQRIREELSANLSEIEASKTSRKKRKIGDGRYVVKSVFGDRYNFDDALGGKFADIHRANASSESSYSNLVDEHSGLFADNLVRSGFGEVKPSAVNYWTEYARTLNRQFANSQVAMKLIAGESPVKVSKWLRGNPDGRVVAKRLKLDPWEYDGHVESIQTYVDNYIPDVAIRERMAKGEAITPEQLRDSLDGLDELPTIHGHVLEENLNMISRQHFKSIQHGIFKLIGSMPEDAFARHPLYISLYRKELQSRVERFEAQQGRALTTAEQADLMDVTHRVALGQLKNTLFTIERRSNLAHLMRFVSPFFAAFENTGKTWAKLAIDKPQIVNRANLIWTAPNRMGIATDQNGNPVPPEQASMEDYIWIEVPKAFKGLPLIGKGLSSLDQMGIQKKSLDVVFQGEGMQVPVGPYVALPISAIVKQKPELEDSLKWAIPYGPERNAIRAFVPAWAKRQLTRMDGQDNQQYANTYALIWMTEQHKRRDNGQKPISAQEVKDKVDAYYNMRTIANLVLPFAPNFQSPYKFYIDQWRVYQEKYGRTASEQYWKDFGDDFFEFSQSLSKNTSGSYASTGAVTAAKQHADLISNLSLVDPSLVGLVTNAGLKYEFSQAAYLWQQTNTISPSGSETFRTRKDPAQATLDNQKDLGWIKYRTVMSQIDAEMQRRGLKSLQVKAASDLAEMKKQLVAQLGSQNSAWYDDYLDTDGSKSNRMIRGLTQIIENDKFMKQHGNDPTFKSLAIYLKIRAEAEAEIAKRIKAGGSAGIDAKSNADIRIMLDQVSTALKIDDIGFGDIYDRWLSYDPVYDKVRSLGGTQ